MWCYAFRLVKALALVGVLLAASSAFAADPYTRELEARRARFEREAGRPQALVPLLGLLDLWDLVQDRGPLVALLDEAAGAAAARPDIRGRAAYLRAIALDRLGRPDQAGALRKQLGLIGRFWVAGPFDNEGKAGHAAVYGPEKADRVDPQASWDGKEHKVGWRLLPELGVQGLVSLDAALRPEANVTAYAAVAVKVPRRTPAAIRVGSSGAIKVWVDGALALSRDVYRPVRFDQDAGPAQLEAGWNRILVKLSGADTGGLGLFLRVTQPDGSPIEGLEISTDLKDVNASPKGKKATFAVAEVGRDLESAAKSGDPKALTDLGIYLHAVAPDDPEKHRAQQVLEEAARKAPSPEAFARLAAAQTDPNDQLRSLELGLELVKGDGKTAAPLQTLLGELDYRVRRERRAEQHWRKALAADPAYWPAQLRLAELESDRGLPARAASMLAELEKSFASVPLKLVRADANLALRRGRRADAVALYGKIAEAQRDDSDALHELFSWRRARGELDASLKLLDQLEKLRPDTSAFALERAELLDGVGRTEDAHKALEGALALAPDDAKLLERDGRLLHRLGREVPALEKLRRSLELRPQNPELRAYLSELEARLQPKAGAGAANDLSRAYAEDVRNLIKKAAPAKPDGSPARVLLDSAVTRVHPNGLSETFTQRVVQILDDRGAREEGDVDLRWTPDTQTLEVRQARVYKPNGDVLEAVSTEETDLSEPWYGLYYDVRGQIIRFSALEPGDVIDVEYVISDVGRRNLFADYFGDLHFFQEELPRLESRYVLIAPRGKKLYFNKPTLAGLTHEEEDRGDETIHRFRAVDTPKVDVEPGMPGYSEVAAYVHVSTYKAWEDVATWYTGLVRSQLEPNAAISSAVRDAVKGLTDERAKIRAVYDLVVKRTRYVGLEFGIHGYQPYRVSQVFARKFGDCKDKASLLVVMLREAGISASLVLARTRHGGDLSAEPASLAPFDHAIAWVPKYNLYLDGTAEFSGADELPAQDQDIPVLQVITGKLVRTPVLPAARNHVVTDWRVALDATGAARVEEQMSISGEAAHEWRNHYQSPGERGEKYDQAWNGKHPGAHVDKLEMSLDDLEKPVSVRASVDVPHWGRPDDDALVMPALGRDADMLRSYARLSTRRHDLVLGYPWLQDEKVTISLPPGFVVRRLPEARTVETPFAKLVMKAEARGSQVVVSATLQVDRHRIATKDYAAFRKFCADVDAAVSQELVIAKQKREAAR
jgi:transglutaminase-like putative cysteine protease/tetratricopeptide (TPR) repeat protein